MKLAKKGNTFLKSLCKDFHKTEYNTSQVPIYLGKDFPYLMEMSSWFQPIYSPPEQLHKFKCLKNVPNCLAIFRHKKNGFGDVNLCSEKKLNAFGVKIKPEFFYAFFYEKSFEINLIQSVFKWENFKFFAVYNSIKKIQEQ